ncbi:MAG: MFS transporter [Candidatus Aminicenantes bacterium]
MSSFRRWLVMACLCMSGGIIYLLPFLREVYYIPLQKALHLNHTQLGVLMSVFGTISMLVYFPGGWLADRVSPRKLLTISLISTGIAGLYFATFPSYEMSIAVHAFWGVSITFVFWAALIKATRSWAPSSEQGRAFGILESGRGISEVVTSTAFLAVFAKLGSGDIALSWVIVLFSISCILLGIMAWFSLSHSGKESWKRGKDRQRIGFQDIIKVLKMPVVWLISVVILAAYSAYWGAYYFTPYATDVFMMSVVFGGALAVGKMWLKPLPALGAGFLSDRIGASKTCAWCFVILIISFSVFVLTPGSPNLVLILIINTAVASLAIFALRGVYFALIEEGGIPLAVTGTATGVVSMVGYTPDAFMPMVGGVLLDGYPGALGYRYFFLFIAVLCILGFLAAVFIRRKYGKKRSPALKKDKKL